MGIRRNGFGNFRVANRRRCLIWGLGGTALASEGSCELGFGCERRDYGCRSKAVASGEMMGGDECIRIQI